MPAPVDPSGIQLSVVVNTPDGVRVPLWVRTQQSGGLAGLVSQATSSVSIGDAAGMLGGETAGSGKELIGVDLPIVESVSIDVTLGLVAQISVQISAEFELGLWLLNTALFSIGNVIEVQIGYPKLARYTPWFTGIAGKPTVSLNPDDGLTVTMVGSGGGLASMRGVSSASYRGKSYREIIQERADANGWEVKFPGAFSIGDLGEALLVDDAVPPLDLTRSQVDQKNLTDWFFIQKMCREAGCDAFLAPSETDEGTQVLYIKQRNEAYADVPELRLLMRGKPDFNRTFPMFTLESEAEGVWLPGAGLKTSSSDIDPDTGERRDLEESEETTDDVTTSDGGVASSASKKVGETKVQLANVDGSQRTGEFLVASARDVGTRAQDALKRMYSEAKARGGFNVKTSTIGLPEFLPGRVVELAGVGLFNGNYYAMSMQHAAGPGDWTTSMDLLNNSAGVIDRFFRKEAAKANTEVTPGTAAAGSGAIGSVVNAVKAGI